MKKSESPRINKTVIVSAFFAAGFICLSISGKIFKNIFELKKASIEKNLESLTNKNVSLGEYQSLSFLGLTIRDIEISDKEFQDSYVKANYVFFRIMPLKSILNRKLIFNINPNKIDINAKNDFLKFESNSFKSESNNRLFNYEIYVNLKNKSNFKISDSNIEGKFTGKFIYRSQENQLIISLNSYLKNNNNFKLRLNRKFNDNFFGFQFLTRGINLSKLNFDIFNNKLTFNNGKLRSNLSFFKTSKKVGCGGKFSLYKSDFNTINLKENINSKFVNLKCVDNKLISNVEELNYGTLISDAEINIPLLNKNNIIQIKGELGYINSTLPEIKMTGTLPYSFQKKGIKFGVLDTNFNLNRTQLSNLNFFRNNGIRGFIVANGKLKGELNNLDTLIDFSIDYPHYKGIRIREIWDGKIMNKEEGYLLKINNRYSPIPSFLSIKFDSNLKLNNLEFSRIFNSNKGSFNIVKNNDFYEWNANNFPLNELELSLQNNPFDRIKGTINGKGLISLDQSVFDGRFALSLGKYRNIKLANSLFKFSLINNNLSINSSLYPIDGGMIDAIYKSNDDNIFSVNFNNISTNWTALTILDILDFKKGKILSNGKSKDLDYIQIINEQKTLDEQLVILNNSLKIREIPSNKKRIDNFLNKFEGRFSSEFDINGDNINNYSIKANLSGYLKEKNNSKNPNRNNFTIKLNGGLINNDGVLEINKLPISLGNLFFNKPKNLKGSLDLKLMYNLDTKSFSSVVRSNKTSINDLNISFQKSLINFKDSFFDVDLSLLIDQSGAPLNLLGSFPLDKNSKLNLRLNGDQRILDLIGNLSNNNFTFKTGDGNLRMLINGTPNQPIANGFLFIKDAEVDIFKNNFNNLNATFIFDFDEIEIKNFEAIGNKSGNISLKGSLPFYKDSKKDIKSINFISDDLQLIGDNINLSLDSNINISGSISNPYIGGNVGLKNGIINLSSNINKSKNKIKNKGTKINRAKSWPELYWSRDKEIEIISNESILNKNLFNENLPESLRKITFNNLYIKLGPDFRIEYANILKVYLETRLSLNLNGNLTDNLNARGLVDIKKGRANLYTTPFKLDKNQDNYILFASRNGIIPYLDFSLTSKVPDTIIPISENSKDINISDDLDANNNLDGFGAFGIGNTRFITIEATYKGFLDQLSFEDENQKIQLRSTPSYRRSQIIGLIGGNSANLINRAFISQLNGTDGFGERLQLSLYPAIIENTESVNNIFSSKALDIEETKKENSNDGDSKQAWIAEIGLDITDSLNFAMQTTPDRDDIPPLWILTLQANEYLELLGSFDSNGEWKSQIQLFFRY